MRNRLVSSAATVALMFTLCQKTHGQDIAKPRQVPDLSGVWMVEKFKPFLFPNGNAPLQPWAEAKFKAANPQTNDPDLACLPQGVPRSMFSPTPMEISQLPTRVMIVHENQSALRQIYMNRKHREDLYPTYSGDAIGRYEGDTLVVDTIGFNDKTWVDFNGFPHSEAMHVIERIRRVDHDTLVDDFTIEDPMAFTKPITTQQVYKLKPGWEVEEYVCTENNKYTYQGR